jgi:D-glycero-D-manno-heptose 1,7-bisphosphate phosphatase
MNKCVIFDRDGVINELVQYKDQLTSPKNLNDLRYLPKVAESVKIIKDLGYLTFVITNQPNISLCKLSEINNTIKNYLGINEIYSAIDQNSNDYKPGTGLFKSLIKKYNIDPSKSYLLGDRWKDIVPGHKTRFTTIFIGESYSSPPEYEHIFPNFVCPSIYQAALLINQLTRKPLYDRF